MPRLILTSYSLQANVVTGPSTPDVVKVTVRAPESARFSLFSRFPVSNGGSYASLTGLPTNHAEQPDSSGYQLFGSSSVAFPSASPLLAVSLY